MEETIKKDVPEELLFVPLWVTMDSPDCEWVQKTRNHDR